MFYDKIGESCSTAGTGTFSLTQTAFGAFRTWRNGPATGTDAFYLATNDAGSTWELGFGTFTTGSPDTLTRTLIASSTGSLINWATTPYRVYSAPVGVVMKHMLSGLINGVANVPGWLPAGAKWWDYTLGIATAWIKKTYISGTRTTDSNHIDEGRAYLGLSGALPNIFVPSPRRLWVDKGANNYTVTTDDVGKVLMFNVTSASRVPTLPAGSTVGHGFRVGLMGYGSTSNSLTVTPNGSDKIDSGSAGATFSIPGGRPVVWLEWDAASSTPQWRTDFVAAPTVPRSHLAGLGTSRASTTTLAVAAGMCADSTGAAIIQLASALTKSTAGAFAAGNNQNGMGNGLTIANSTWYHVYAFVPSGGVPVNGVYAGDVYFDTSASGANKPTGALYFRRIASFRTNGSAQIINYVQDGDHFQWDATVADVSDTNPGTSLQTKTLTVPTGLKVWAEVIADCAFGSSGNAKLYLHDLAVSDEAAATGRGYNNATSAPSGVTNGWKGFVRTNTSAQVGYRLNVSGGADVVTLSTVGWLDARGRND